VEQVLLTALGKGKYETVTWFLSDHHDGPVYSSCFAPVATTALVGGMKEAVVLLTPEARETHWEACKEEFLRLGVTPRDVPIPPGLTNTQVWQIFESICTELSDATNVTVDVTHAFRHVPLVLLASLSYMVSLKRITLQGVYYGAYEARGEGRAPLLNLAPLLDLSEWAYAAKSLVETGNSAWLANALDRERRNRALRGSPLPDIGRLQRPLEELAGTLPAGLPLETGQAANRALECVRRLVEDGSAPAMLRPLLVLLQEILSDISLPDQAMDKANIALDLGELERELRVIRRYFRWGQRDRCLILLREWVLNRCLLASDKGESWLDYEATRYPTERLLNGLAERRRRKQLREELCGAVDLWNRIKERRNAIAHAGFKQQNVKLSKSEIEEVIRECEELFRSDSAWDIRLHGSLGRLLVTPLGKSPGVLFTALKRLLPGRVLVVTSRDTQHFVEEACRKAGFDLALVCAYSVEDAYDCFEEGSSFVDWARQFIFEAEEVCVNVTGGTTAMQYLVERVASDAERVGVRTRRYALIDRRPFEEQQCNPYVLGQVRELRGDGPLEDDGSG